MSSPNIPLPPEKLSDSLPPEIRTPAQAAICSLLIVDEKKIRDVETQAAPARGQGEGRGGSPEGWGLEEPSRQWRGASPANAAALARRFGGHPTMIHQWKRALLTAAAKNRRSRALVLSRASAPRSVRFIALRPHASTSGVMLPLIV
jgi:hypothetical protein